MHGHGVFYYDDETMFVGDFRNNVKCGNGTFMNTEGETYKGKWKNDVKHGIGEIEKGNVITKGRWKNGELAEILE